MKSVQLKWSKLALIGLTVAIGAGLVFAVVFVARKLAFQTTESYTAFFALLAAVGAWFTGLLLVFVAYQQWKLGQSQFKLQFIPDLILKPQVTTPVTGPMEYNHTCFPYRIEWTVFLHNPSQIPIVVDSIKLSARVMGEDPNKRVVLSPLHAHVLEPEGLKPPFLVLCTSPLKIRWIVEGPNAGDPFDYLSKDASKRDFELLCYVAALVRHQQIIEREVLSSSFYLGMNASWGSSSEIVQLV